MGGVAATSKESQVNAHNNIVTSAIVNASNAGSNGGISTAGNVVIRPARGWLLP